AYMYLVEKMGRKKTEKKQRTREKAAARTEAEFLASYDPSQFERPSLTVDVVLLSAHDGALSTLLLRRDEHPDKGRWSLPGGFVQMTESLDDAAARVLAQKTGLASVFLEQLYTFGAPRRDPRTRVVTVAYYALVDRRRFDAAKGARDGAEVRVARVDVGWEGETGGPVDLVAVAGEAPLAMAFDHAD